LSQNIKNLIEENKNDFFRYLNRVCASDSKLMVYGNLKEILDDFIKRGKKKNNYKAISEVIQKVTESVTIGNSIYFELRQKIGHSVFYMFNLG
jgi:hypothetical protein